MLELDTAIDKFAEAETNFREWKQKRDTALAGLLPYLFNCDWSKSKRVKLTSALSGVEISVEFRDAYKDNAVNILVKLTAKGESE